jgi:SAM-dependent methyltransferase
MWDNQNAFHAKEQDDNWWWEKARREIIQQCLKKVVTPKVDILEIGAGFGSMSSMLSGFGPVSAIEPYHDAALYLREKLKIESFHSSFESFTATKKYDMVACFDVLEHIEDDKNAILKMESLLKNKGLLVVTVPAYKFLWSGHDEINHHFRRYRKKELLNKIPRVFSIKKISYFNSLLFPIAILDKLVLAKNKKSSSFDPNKIVNSLLYRIFSTEKSILQFTSLPFGVSLLLIAQKQNPC